MTLINRLGISIFPPRAAEILTFSSCERLRTAYLEETSADYINATVSFDRSLDAGWCFMQPRGRPSYTPEVLRDLAAVQTDLPAFYHDMAATEGVPMRWFVMGSRTPGIFSLGGDLHHFADRIRARDLTALQCYGHACVETAYRTTTAFGLPVITIALVQGDALGGGFEHALSADLIVAERSAKLGFPEVLFNMFPGMGAYSFLSRRLDRRRAEEMILSGRIYTAEELHEAGVVDVLAEDGGGEEAVREYIAAHARKHNAQLGLLRARRCVNPVTLQELTEVVEVWAQTALNLTPPDLRKMDRLIAAQDRRLGLHPAPGREALRDLA